MIRHFELIDAVNDAKTEREHAIAYARLRGWREGVVACGQNWSGITADHYTMEKHGEDVDMCCGVIMRTGESWSD